MLNLEYHKGSFCAYMSVFCQEGYCSGCEIYRKGRPSIEQADRHEVVGKILFCG